MADTANQHDIVPALPKQNYARSSVFFELDERQNEFLATLAHELRNPLAPIMNGLHLMAMMNLGDDRQQRSCLRLW
jgi:signal transduction histidine kinase